MTNEPVPTNFDLVSRMNVAFNNPKGDPKAIDWLRLRKQCQNIIGEYTELMRALDEQDVTEVRDALCDINVFSYGAHHFMGYDADKDMRAVVAGVMTRFCRNKEELEDTVTKYVRLGIPATNLRVEGEFPQKCLKVIADCTDQGNEFYAAGKFLKSVGFKQTVFEG